MADVRPVSSVGSLMHNQMRPGVGRVWAVGTLVLPRSWSVDMLVSEMTVQVLLRRERVTTYLAGDEDV